MGYMLQVRRGHGLFPRGMGAGVRVPVHGIGVANTLLLERVCRKSYKHSARNLSEGRHVRPTVFAVGLFGQPEQL